MDHPDNYYVADAIDKLHEEMIRLNQSIKSCQLACSVRRVQSRKSFRFSRGVRRSNTRISMATQLKRYFYIIDVMQEIISFYKGKTLLISENIIIIIPLPSLVNRNNKFGYNPHPCVHALFYTLE